jgi:hypothetical protein
MASVLCTVTAAYQREEVTFLTDVTYNNPSNPGNVTAYQYCSKGHLNKIHKLNSCITKNTATPLQNQQDDAVGKIIFLYAENNMEYKHNLLANCAVL